MGKRFNIPTKTTTVALNHQQTNANEKLLTFFLYQFAEEECYTGKGYHYRGPVNVSTSGNACVNWDFKADPTRLFVRPDR